MVSWILSWLITAVITLVIEAILLVSGMTGVDLPESEKAVIAFLGLQMGIAIGSRWVILQQLDVALGTADSSRSNPPEWMVTSTEWLGEPVPARIAPLLLIAAIAVVLASPLLWASLALSGLWGIGALWIGALFGGIAHPDRSQSLLDRSLRRR